MRSNARISPSCSGTQIFMCFLIPEEFVKTQIAGLHPQSSSFRRSGVGPWNLLSSDAEGLEQLSEITTMELEVVCTLE